MAESTTVARPYAQAVFQLARETQSVDAWSDTLALAAAVAVDAQMQPLLDSPRLTETQLGELFADICGEDLSEPGRNFIRLLAENRRLGVLPEIARLYEALRNEAEGSIQARLITALPVTEEQKAVLSKALKQRLGRDIQLDSSVDPRLLGGAIIRAGDLVIDGSVQGKLARLASVLSH
jgi:F-type H+-transporting ATPase subunit delta